MAFLRPLVTCVFVLASTVAGVGVAVAAPAVTVTPSAGLVGGNEVVVQASGLDPNATVRVIECDEFNGDLELDCPDLAEVAAGSDGQLTVAVTLKDPVYRSQPFGDAHPVYCRADGCRIFLVWTDQEGGGQQVLSSAALEFEGSPATITAAPTTDLRKSQKLTVRGTAVGAEGQTVVVVQEACFNMVQGSGCYGTRILGSTAIGSDGSWSMRVRVRRLLVDGTDCASADILGSCQLTARVLDAAGQPDDSFGVARSGQPGVALSFSS
jgi:Neocarzinostatin family